jgi:hypothetical protein
MSLKRSLYTLFFRGEKYFYHLVTEVKLQATDPF